MGALTVPTWHNAEKQTPGRDPERYVVLERLDRFVSSHTGVSGLRLKLKKESTCLPVRMGGGEYELCETIRTVYGNKLIIVGQGPTAYTLIQLAFAVKCVNWKCTKIGAQPTLPSDSFAYPNIGAPSFGQTLVPPGWWRCL